MSDAAAAEADQEPLPLKIFDSKPLTKTVAYFGALGIVKEEEKAPLRVAERANHALFARLDASGEQDEQLKRQIGDFLEQREAFKQALASGPVEALIEQGKVNELVTGYLAILAARAQARLNALELTPSANRNMPASEDEFNRQLEDARAKADKYGGELTFYRDGAPEMVKDAVKAHPFVLTAGKFLQFGDIVAEAKAAGADDATKARMRDRVDDALARKSANEIKMLGLLFDPAGAMAAHDASPGLYATQINAGLLRIVNHAKPLVQIEPPESAQTGLGRIQALQFLLLAEMRAEASAALENKAGGPAEREAVIDRLRDRVKDYAQAALSLSHAFLGEGAAKDDAVVLKIRTQLEKEMQDDQIALLTPPDAEAKARALAEASAQTLRQYAASDPAQLAKTDRLLAATAPAERVTQPAEDRQKGFAEAIREQQRAGEQRLAIGA